MLENIWFFIWGILWAGYFVLDGFDLGIAGLFPLYAKTDREKKIVLSTVGPYWDGNEVWLITAGAMTFAAFPTAYAVLFSSLYTPLMVILFALILRGVSFELRTKVESRKWVSGWDAVRMISSILVLFLFGVAFFNLFSGIPIDGDGFFRGTVFSLLTPYGVLGGVMFVVVFFLHGALWLGTKTTGIVRERAVKTARALWPVCLTMVALALVLSWFASGLYANYLAHPVLFVIPIAAVIAAIVMRVLLTWGRAVGAFIASCAAVVGILLFGVVGLFPFLIPSSLDPAYGITAMNAASGHKTLTIMLVVTVVFIPIVVLYQLWAYRLFAGTVDEENVIEQEY